MIESGPCAKIVAGARTDMAQGVVVVMVNDAVVPVQVLSVGPTAILTREKM